MAKLVPVDPNAKLADARFYIALRSAESLGFGVQHDPDTEAVTEKADLSALAGDGDGRYYLLDQAGNPATFDLKEAQERLFRRDYSRPAAAGSAKRKGNGGGTPAAAGGSE